MRKITCGCGTTVRAETDDAVVDLAERHIAVRHGGVAGAASREDLLALAEEERAVDGERTAGART